MAEPRAINYRSGNESAKTSELADARWSVISFDRVEVKSVPYDEAAVKMNELESAGVAGLCIVADEAAERVK